MRTMYILLTVLGYMIYLDPYYWPACGYAT